MENDCRACLFVEKGEPYHQWQSIPLKTGRTEIGRAWQGHHPHVAFSNGSVSRQHAVLAYDDGAYTLTDFSRYGTSVNGIRLGKGEPHPLKDKDRIVLAGGQVVFIFSTSITQAPPQAITDIVLDRPYVIIEGHRIRLTPTLFKLFALLHQHCGHAVAHEDIKKELWPEEVGMRSNEDVAIHIKRLHDALGEKNKQMIKSEWGTGYRLE